MYRCNILVLVTRVFNGDIIGNVGAAIAYIVYIGYAITYA